MNLLSFHKRFPDEDACRDYLKEKREEIGVVCNRCGCEKHYWVSTKSFWKCADCGSWTNLKAGTIMEKSKMPIQIWFMCIHLMTSTKKSFSALEMQRQLGWKRYEPIWLMMQKVRKSMGKRDGRYQLQGDVELDGAFFEIVDLSQPSRDEDGTPKKKKQGDTSGKKKVLVMVESKPIENPVGKHNKGRKMGFVKMFTMDYFSKPGINYEVQKGINPRSTVYSDKFSAYYGIGDYVDTHIKERITATEQHKKLPWVHTVISNAKRLLLGVHHSIGTDYLQNYLNEYCYKLNRRNFQSDLFDRMILAGVNDTWY